MLRYLLGSRGWLSVAVILVLGAAVVGGYRLVLKPTPRMRDYCALMPDSIGLYRGSAVTIMGIPEGTVTAISPDGDTARVEFRLPVARTLPPDVGATTVSDTLVADRRLAIIGTARPGASWNPLHCITKTTTPKSLTRTFTAIADLADQLNGADDPAHPNLIAGGLAALDKTTAGTGDRINAIINELASALHSPDAAIGHIADLLDALSSLIHTADNGWADVESMLTRLAQTLRDVNTIALPPIIDVVAKTRDLLPSINDITTMFGGPVLRRLDAVQNLPQLLTAGVGSLRQIIDMVPVLTGAFADAVDPRTGRVTLTYAPAPAAPIATLLPGLAGRR